MPKDKPKKLTDFNAYLKSKVIIPDNELEDAIMFFNANIDDIAAHYGVDTSIIRKQIKNNVKLTDTYNYIKDDVHEQMFMQANDALKKLMADAEQPSARVQASKAVLNFYGKTHGYNRAEIKIGTMDKPELEIHEELYEAGE